ncbi:MAG: BrnA antitoxin family protein [Dysgonamonadaceae bacterium]|jgi:uncharacterized protein (DUF4415 family)|nr:BrnA antitoxin family protein [Dysgonamonadaceae bacterium]
MAIVKYTEKELGQVAGQTDWEYLKKMTEDNDIDFSDIPEWTDEMFANATRGGVPPVQSETPGEPQKVSLTIHVQPSLLENYRQTGKGWRTRLSNHIEAWLRQTQNTAAS